MIFFVFSFQRFDCKMSWHEFLWVSPVWGSLSFLNVYIYDLQNFGNVQPLFLLVLSQLFPFPSLLFGASMTQILVPLLQSHKFLFWLFFKPTLFLLCFSNLGVCFFFYFSFSSLTFYVFPSFFCWDRPLRFLFQYPY